MTSSRLCLAPTIATTAWPQQSGHKTSAKHTVSQKIFVQARFGLTVTTSSTLLCHLEGTNSLDGAARWVTMLSISTRKQKQFAQGCSAGDIYNLDAKTIRTAELAVLNFRVDPF